MDAIGKTVLAFLAYKTLPVVGSIATAALALTRFVSLLSAAATDAAGAAPPTVSYTHLTLPTILLV